MAVEVIVRRARADHARELAPRMRRADAAECAATGHSPIEALQQSLGASLEAWSVFFDGELAFMWGVADTLAGDLRRLGRGCAWLLGSDLIERRAKAFWRYCLATLPSLLDRYCMIANYMDARHEQAVRWGLRLGFRFGEAEAFGGVSFYPFSLTKEDFVCARSL